MTIMLRSDLFLRGHRGTLSRDDAELIHEERFGLGCGRFVSFHELLLSDRIQLGVWIITRSLFSLIYEFIHLGK